jgi:hypothetical protein
MRLRALALIVLCALWSCSGGGGTQGVAAVAPTTGTTPASPTGSAPVSSSARFTITVPAQSTTTSSTTRTPKYVSPATQSIIITLVSVGGVPYTGSPASIATNLSTLNPACTGTTSLTCTVTAPAVVGSDVFSVVTYDTAQTLPFTTPAGNVLSRASLSVAVVAGPNVVTTPLVLNGVPASFAIAPPAGTAGTAFSQTVIIAVKDAAGNTIVGSYANPVTLSDGDTSGATTLATSGSDNPSALQLLSSSDNATLSYTGLAIAGATISAAATGATAGNGSFTPTLQPIVVTTGDTQNPSFAGVDFYATSGAGSSGSFTISEIGWTNAPYSKTLTVTPGSGCSTIGSVLQNGNSFTASVAGAPAPSTCNVVTLSDPFGQSQAVTLAYTNFAYTGASQSITVPAGVTSVTVAAAGAAGGRGFEGTVGAAVAGGTGGSVTATISVASGALTIAVGGLGGSTGSSTGGSAGFGGGGPGGSGDPGIAAAGGGGGGATTLSQGAAMLIVAGGGGGGAGIANPTAGGTGGAGGGATGVVGLTPGGGGGGGGAGGTQTIGGVGGIAGGRSASAGASGSSLAGGGGATFLGQTTTGGGGGGGGYFGGGGGGSGDSSVSFNAGGGGGGSSFIEASATNVTNTQGGQTGNGSVTISW